jgi:hypothetical protein
MAPDKSSSEDRWHGVYLDVLEQVHAILRDRTLTVYKAHRKIEIETTFEGRAALNNLVDVLAHLATLLMKADTMSRTEQVAQLVNIEDHLRRAMMEGQEQVVNDLLDEVAVRWDEYMLIAGPLRAEGILINAPSHRQLEQFRAEIGDLLDTGRGLKPEAAWDEHLEGAGYFKEAAKRAQELIDGLNQCIGASQQILAQRKSEARSTRINAASLAVGITGLAFAVVVLLAH